MLYSGPCVGHRIEAKRVARVGSACVCRAGRLQRGHPAFPYTVGRGRDASPPLHLPLAVFVPAFPRFYSRLSYMFSQSGVYFCFAS